MIIPGNFKLNYQGKTYRGGDELPDDIAKKIGLFEEPTVDYKDDIVPKKIRNKKDGE